MLELTLDILRTLVAHDTSNPPRRIARDGITAAVESRLRPAGFAVEVADLGEGCINLLAVRGEPDLLFNVHLDTVPASGDWESDPHELVRATDCVVGLGACDVKGAAACMLAAAASTAGPAAILFTTDEEAGEGRCVRAYLREPPPFVRGVVVAEPTGCKAVTAHRGLDTCEGVFRGIAAHGSSADGSERSAVHDAARWMDAALEYAAAAEEERFEALCGIRLNVGVFEGGIKANVVAPRARVVFGVRPRPDQDAKALLARLCSLGPPGAEAAWTPRFSAPALRATGRSAALLRGLGLEPRGAVDFWTEAALFAEAGLPSIVFGPGLIAQAHTANEWIALDQLERGAHTYTRLFSGAAGGQMKTWTHSATS